MRQDIGSSEPQPPFPDRAGFIGPDAPGPEVTASELLERYKLAVTLTPVPALLVDAEGMITATNEALDRLFLYPSRALIGQNIERLVPLSSQHRHPALRQAFNTRPSRREMGQGREVHGQRADGSFVPVEIGLSPIPLGDELLTFTTVIDISERHMGERRLREALDAAATAMVLVAPDGTIELVNTAACQLLGGFSAEIVGRDVDTFVPREHRLKHAVFRQSYLSAPRPRAMTDANNLRVVGLDGQETPVHIALTPINGVGGQRIMATLVDLREILAQERALAMQNAQLSALNEELTQFAYSASHDLRAPLATIAGLLELCLEDLSDGEMDECTRNISEALKTSRRNIHKVEQVLTLARAGLEAIDLETVDLVEATAAIWDDLSCGGLDKPAFCIVASGPACFEVERPTLLTVIENLLSNACRFQDSGKPFSWVELRILDRPDGVELQIRDNGVGIPEADQARVFEMFRRSGSSSGHGLGLTLVQKHVRRLNGTIALDSSPEGTRFTLSLPLRRSQ
ncbi:PAS/PAC sensor signal transduction histidine kinase [Pseudooceanicola antarcticus]|uniref:histidine kinase n=1 Tax=Pseudooceanicola antarcticus TaxID=1247613 RepID=A0A285JHM0_9RHOB|nr:PAS domain-containing sensor histidine kinase [Pseudooceanicola antarcticus]PJE31037.1 PAS domain-containing sensor histidine kinase [Pseudooceanicola antarcticus]SNY58876.1 PAS/PAC sensor signal transduction histidine kinase [Pseudooceanicola antarcticus]